MMTHDNCSLLNSPAQIQWPDLASQAASGFATCPPVRQGQSWRTRTRMIAIGLLSALILPLAAAAADHVPLDNARALLAAGNASAAYDDLSTHLMAGAGDPAFDLLFGQAALAADHPTEAVFAFERCLLVQPSQDECRLGLAQAHLSLKELAEARSNLASLTTETQSSETANAVAAEYRRLLAEQQHVKTQDTRLSVWLQAGLGFDSNLNTATNQSDVWVPLYSATVPLQREGQRRDSFFHRTQLAAEYSLPLNQNWRLLLNGSVQYKQYWRGHDYDGLQVDTSVGLQRSEGPHRITFRGIGQYYNLGGRAYRSLGSFLTQYSYALSDQTEIGGFAQYTRLHYPHASQQRNADRGVLGLTWSRHLAEGQALLYGTLYGGREATVRSRYSSSRSHDLGGVRMGAMWLMSPRTRLDFGASFEQRHYDGRDRLFRKTRRDSQYGAWLGLNYAINRRLSLRPRYQYTHNDSNIVLRDYQRHVITVDLRYELF